MENSKKSAYPTVAHTLQSGLDKREYFAGLAMQGLLAANATYGKKTDDRVALAKDAVLFADALIKELENEK